MNDLYANIGLTILLWGIYFFLHSALATSSIKGVVRNVLNWSERAYRRAYSLVAGLTLLPVFYYLSTTKSDVLLTKGEFLKYFSLALSTWGIIIIKQAMKGRMSQFLGLKSEQIAERLSREGLYRYVRHPLYLGTILLCLGFWLFIPNVLNLVSVLCIFLYLKVGIRLEERKLIQKFGDEYIRFRKVVPAIFPDIKSFFKSGQRTNS